MASADVFNLDKAKMSFGKGLTTDNNRNLPFAIQGFPQPPCSFEF